MILWNLLVVITFIVANINISSCLEREMTIHINAKERECFFEKIGEKFFHSKLQNCFEVLFIKI